MQAVYNAVMAFYDHGKPWKEEELTALLFAQYIQRCMQRIIVR